MDEITLKLDSPITEEQWDHITDVDFESTDRIWFHTKHGKDVEFVKQRKGEWIVVHNPIFADTYYCSECKEEPLLEDGEWALTDFCPHCGAQMVKGEEDEGI